MILTFKLVDGSVLTSDKLTFDSLVAEAESEQAAVQLVESLFKAIDAFGSATFSNIRIPIKGIPTVVPGRSILWIQVTEQFSDSDTERMNEVQSAPRRPQPRYGR